MRHLNSSIWRQSVFCSLLLGGVLLASTAHGDELDLTNTSTSGCDDQWVGACISNPVWGADDVLGIDTPTTIPVLTIGASSENPTRVALARESITGDSLFFTLKGNAHSSDTVVSVETNFFNASNQVIGSVTDVLHSGTEGMFSISVARRTLPGAAVKFRSRLLVEGDAVVVAEFQGDGTRDCGLGDCWVCDKDCGDYTALGIQCDGFACTAECVGVFGEEDLVFQSGVELNP